MANITLTDPVAGTTAVAGLVAGNNTALRTAINGGLDNTNVAANAAIDLSKLAAAGWTAYTPTLTGSTSGGTLGNATVVARYQQIGKVVVAYGSVTWGSTTSAGVGNLQLALPVTPNGNTSGVPIGTVQAFDTSAGAFGYFASVAGATVFNIQYAATYPTGVQTIVSATVPWTWAVGDIIRWAILYEAA